jgi:circadian clock protein KaiC
MIHALRPSLQGLEMHLLVLLRILKNWKPQTVVIDPISSLITIGKKSEVRAMLIRLIDILKINGINALFTSLTSSQTESFRDETVEAVSSLADTWIELYNTAGDGRRERSLVIVKTRGMGHYNNPVELKISDNGIAFTKVNSKKLTSST